MVLNVVKPASFYSEEKNILVYDDKGDIFYNHPNRQGKITFNLPVGKYMCNNIIREVGFKAYVPFEYKFKDEGFKAVVKPNPHKASIFPLEKKIVVTDKVRFEDKSSLNIDEYLPCVTFLLCHELGHRIVGGNKFNKKGKIIFDAEQKCDDIAENYMLSHGFNPSQIKICKQLILSTPKRRECSQYDSKQMNFRR